MMFPIAGAMTRVSGFSQSRSRQGDVMVLSYQEGWNWPKIEGGYQSNDGNVVNAVKRGMDVSYWQGLINWERAKADGIDFAILRCGYVKTLGQPQVDQQWKRNAQECERLAFPTVSISTRMPKPLRPPRPRLITSSTR